MVLNLDPKLGQTACDTILDVLGGDAQAPIIEGYNVAKASGEDNPMVEAFMSRFKEYSDFWNEQVMPVANRLKANFEGFSNMAEFFNKAEFNKVKQGEDVGQVADANYDAATDL